MLTSYEFYYLLISYLIKNELILGDEIRKLTREILDTNEGVLALVVEFEKINSGLHNENSEKSALLEDFKKNNSEQSEKIKKQERALIQADKMASLGQLVAGMAHEINNPMTYIRSNIELMQKYWKLIAERTKPAEDPNLKSIVEDFDEVLNSMLRGSDRIVEIVRGLRLFSRQEKAEFSKVDLYEPVQDAYTLIKNEFIRYKIVFINKLSKGEGIILGSKQQMEQVFINLFLNSIKAIKEYSDTNERIVEVSSTTNGKGFISVSVKDNGCGICEENINMIFNPFFTTRLEDGGTGLGLSVVYGIIRGHNGNIRVYSYENEGTEFIMEFPTYG